jgi:leukotriene-A4 hydrolase
MIEVAESLYGPYRWERYDLLILPPSFPFGGMENPRLSFITPTVIVGDKSLVSLIAHELAHSWSGNLVTNASWKDMWLNEGFTSYVENRIVEALFGEEQAAMENLISQDACGPRLGPGAGAAAAGAAADARRRPRRGADRRGLHQGPVVPAFLEQRFGRERFDPFLRAWFDAKAFQSVTARTSSPSCAPNCCRRRPRRSARTNCRPGCTARACPTVHRRDLAALRQGRRAAPALARSGRSPPRRSTPGAGSPRSGCASSRACRQSLPGERLVELDAAFAFTGTATARSPSAGTRWPSAAATSRRGRRSPPSSSGSAGPASRGPPMPFRTATITQAASMR